MNDKLMSSRDDFNKVAVLNDYRERTLPDTPSFGGGDGGGRMDNLEKRVANLEDDVKVIRNDLTTLMVRSESFATKADISDIRAEMAALRGDLRTEMSTQGGELRTTMSTQSGELRTELQKAFNKHTLLLLTLIPAAFALVTFLFDFFKR